MPVPRRTLALAGGIAAVGSLAAWQLWPRPSAAPVTSAGAPPASAPPPAAASAAPPAPATTLASADPRLGERSSGSPTAPVVVTEYFSLTCSHCAAFHGETWPRVKSELVDTGRLRMVWADFPLDQLALAAMAVARSLPVERFEGFVSVLFQTQSAWAFARGVDNKAEVFRFAALAGMSREDFDAAWTNEPLQRGILELRLRGERTHNVQATPSFVFGNRTVSGAISFDRFLAEMAR